MPVVCFVASRYKIMASTKTLPISNEWNEEKCIKLIREYRARPALWDRKYPLFYRKSVKLQAWEEIGKILNIPADDCKHKMMVLLSSFRREKARLMHSIEDMKDGRTKFYTSVWFGFNELAFLMDKESERKRLARSSHDDDDDDEDSTVPMPKKIALRLPRILSQRRRQSKVSRLPAKTELPRATPQRQRDENVVSQSPPSPSPSTSMLQQSTSETMYLEGEIKSFAAFIANKMNKYSETTKNAVQQAICEVVFKADQGFYEAYKNNENYCYSMPSIKISEIKTESDPLDKTLRTDSDDEVVTIKQLIESDDSE